MPSEYYFYKFLVTDQVFFRSTHSFALVNLKPIVPGHVLVISNRCVDRLQDLNDDESMDYMSTVRIVSKFIENHYNADALNLAIQDGFHAGQSVPHLHTHVIPRYKSDKYGDMIYDKLDKFNLAMKKSALLEEIRRIEILEKKPDEWDEGKRVPREHDVMAKEAQQLAESLEKFRLEQKETV